MERPVVIITGSSSGLGLATADALLESGACVVLSSIEDAELAKAFEQRQQPFAGKIAAFACDVRDPNQVQALLNNGLEHFGEVTAWINNAGVTAASGPTVDTPWEMGSNVIAVNINGCYHGSLVALRHFEKQGAGKLINVTGRGETGPQAQANLYSSSKAWIRNFTLALAKENVQQQSLAPERNIQIGTFNPGLLYTHLTQQPLVLQNHEEKTLKGLRTVMSLIGDSPERAAKALAELMLGERPFQLENRSRRLLPFALKRLLTGQRAAVDLDAITARVISKENGAIGLPAIK